MTESSNYYYRFPDVLEDRMDFVYYHPKFDKIMDIKNKYKFPPYKLSEYIVNAWTGDNLRERDNKEKKYLYIKVENISNNKIIITPNSEFLSENELSRLSNSIPKANSVLVTRVASFGRSAVVETGFNGAISDNVLCFEFDEHIDPYFASRFINSPLAQIQLQRQAAGMGRGVLTYDRIGDLWIGVPSPKEEQSKIIKRIEAVESEIASLDEEVLRMLSRVETVFLTLLGIPLPVQLNNISYYADYVNEFNRLDFEFNNPKYDVINTAIANSKAEFAELVDVVDFLQDSRNPTERPEEDFLYADIGNVDTRWGELNSVTMKGEKAKSSRMRRVMYEGNVLVSTTRPTRNAIAIVPKELDKQICSTGFAILKCKPTMNNRFLFHALRTWLSNLQFAKHCSGSGYPAINQETDLPHIRVPVLPSIEDQAEIASEVDDLMSKAREIEDESKNKQQIAKTVFVEAII
jgi:restriction endonuclease S subunit